MISQKQRDEFLVTHYLNEQKVLEAEALIDKSGEINELLRQVALIYSDLDDLENSLRVFKKAYECGDKKSLPWLIELLQNFYPDDSELPELLNTRDQLLATRDFDVLFSMGNMHITRREFSEAIETWSNLLQTDNWMIERNLLSELVMNPDNEVVLEALGFKGSGDINEVILFLKERYQHFLKRHSEALLDFFYFCQRYVNHPAISEIAPEALLDMIHGFALEGSIQSIFVGHSMALSGEMKDSRFEELIQKYDLTELAKISGLELETRGSVTGSRSINQVPTGNYSSNNAKSNEIFERADVAIKNNDLDGELAIWIEGAKQGIQGCFNNIAVPMANKLGITTNLLIGASGGEDSAWSPLVKGIQMSEMKPAEFNLISIDNPLGSSVIKGSLKERLPQASKENINKFSKLIEYLGFVIKQLDENLFCLPFGFEGTFIPIFAELINDEGKDSLLIYAPILSSKIERSNVVINPVEPLSKFELEILKVLIRDVHLVFPNSGLYLGDSFSRLPSDRIPIHFTSSQKVQEIWSCTGPAGDEIIVEPLPTSSEFTIFQFGIASDLSLQSDHFETAVRESFKQVIGVANHLTEMYGESLDYWNQFFDHMPITSTHYQEFVVDDEAAAKQGFLGAQIRKHFKAYLEKQKLENLQDLVSLNVPLAKRALTAIDLNKANVQLVAKNLMELAENYEEDVEIRNALNNVGWFYMNQNSFDEALPYLLTAARLGSANAMSNLSWQLMLLGRHQESVDYHNKFYYRILTTRYSPIDFDQASNLRSNNALNLWALGTSTSELKAIWDDEFFQGSHVESKFYPILIDFLQGEVEASRNKVQSFDDSIKRELITTFEETSTHQGWFGEISRKSLELLGHEAKKRRGLFGRG